MDLARSVSLDEHQNRIWDLIIAFNTLRNELAHTLDSPKRKRKLEALKSLYLDIAADMEGVEEHQHLEDKIVTTFAAALCLGFLAAFEQEVRRFRDWVNLLDKAVNSHRYQNKSRKI